MFARQAAQLLRRMHRNSMECGCLGHGDGDTGDVKGPPFEQASDFKIVIDV